MRASLLLFVLAVATFAHDKREADIDVAREHLNAASAILAKQQDRVSYLQTKVDGIKARVDASEGVTRCLALQEQRYWEEEFTASQLQLQRFDIDLAPFAHAMERVMRRSYRDESVRPGSLIDVTIMPAMIRDQYLVNERGYVLLPRISLLYVGCLNVNQCEEQIRQRMVDRGYHDSWVHVRIVDDAPANVGPITATFAPRIIATQKDILKLEARLGERLEWWERLNIMEEICRQQQALDHIQSALDADINAARLPYTVTKRDTISGGFESLLNDHNARAEQLARKVAAIQIRVKVLEHMLADDDIGYKKDLAKDHAFWLRRLGEARIEADCHNKLTAKHASWLEKAMAKLPDISTEE